MVLKVRQLSTVTPERVEFLWKPFLPQGRPVAIEGDPGIGKSSLVAKIVTHVTTGKAFPTVLEGHSGPSGFLPTKRVPTDDGDYRGPQACLGWAEHPHGR